MKRPHISTIHSMCKIGNTYTLLFCLILFASCCSIFLASCSSEKPDNIEPTLHTLEATNITRTSATLNGSVSLQGKTAMPSVVFKYGKGDLSQSASASNEDGNVMATINGLTAGTTYQFQLQAVGSGAALFGNTMTFTTLPNVLPTVGAASILSHGPVSAIIGFDVPDNGGEQLTDVGCYVVEGNAATLADRAKAKIYKAREVADEEKPWRAIANGLKMNTTYTVFPYAANSIGEKVGDGIELTTGEAYIVAVAGDLASLLEDSNIGESISIVGPLNGDDLACLRKLSLKSIDMTDAHIVSGGGTYDGSHFTEANAIGPQLFAGCTSLVNITLPDDVTTIAKDAFYGCTGLKEISIPSATNSVSPSGGCASLQDIYVSPANTSFQSVDGVLTNEEKTKLIWFPNGRTGEYSLPDNITSLGQGAFYESSIEKITLSDKLKTISTATFQHCSKLRTINLGSATELISDYAFDGCPLADLYVSATTPPVCTSNAFTTTGNDFTKTCTLHVPQGCARYYRASRYWNVFEHIVE